MQETDMKHIAIFKKEETEQILSGKKNINHWFSKHRIAPFGVVSSGDLVYIKISGRDIVGQFKVKRVIFYDGLETAEDRKYKYKTTIYIGESTKFITSPIKLKKKDLRGWMVLDNK